MTYLERFEELPARDIAALTHIGRLRALTSYQLRSLSFPAVGLPSMFRRLACWRSLELVHTTRIKTANCDVHSLRPGARLPCPPRPDRPAGASSSLATSQR